MSSLELFPTSQLIHLKPQHTVAKPAEHSDDKRGDSESMPAIRLLGLGRATIEAAASDHEAGASRRRLSGFYYPGEDDPRAAASTFSDGVGYGMNRAFLYKLLWTSFMPLHARRPW